MKNNGSVLGWVLVAVIVLGILWAIVVPMFNIRAYVLRTVEQIMTEAYTEAYTEVIK